jgi:hypothetical protein
MRSATAALLPQKEDPDHDELCVSGEPRAPGQNRAAVPRLHDVPLPRLLVRRQPAGSPCFSSPLPHLLYRLLREQGGTSSKALSNVSRLVDKRRRLLDVARTPRAPIASLM